MHFTARNHEKIVMIIEPVISLAFGPQPMIRRYNPNPPKRPDMP